MISQSPSDYQVLEDSDFPKIGDTLAFDIYVQLPRAQRFLRYVCAGDIWDERRKKVLLTHTNPTLYKSRLAAPAGHIDSAPSVEAPQELIALNETVKTELSDIFRVMNNPSEAESPQTIKAMEDLSQKIIEVVAPEHENLRETILQKSRYLMVMSDSAALTSIAVLIALAHGFDSRKIFQDLSMAIILMDAPLATLSEETVLKYYRDPNSLTTGEWQEIRRHPAQAHEAVSSRLKSVSNSVLQLILNHHELYNSKGYPRQLRNEMLPPIVRSLAVSVDVFEIIKREHLNGKDIDILQALETLREPTVEAHLRRHNQKLIQSAFQYVQTQTAHGADSKS
jgi:HD-GYP domain-containing protein (c-di-GMP phosphodiesterase class II)